MTKVKSEVGNTLNVEPAINSAADKERAVFRAERYKRNFEISVDQVTGLSKWLTASLFAANSGGLLTILNQSAKVPYLTIAGGLFIIGLILALLSATANQEIYNRMSEPLADMISYWNEVSITGSQSADDYDAIEAKIINLKRWFWIGPLVGWFSGIAFIAGTIAIAAGIR